MSHTHTRPLSRRENLLPEQDNAPVVSIISYQPAVVRHQKDNTIVEFYALNPSTNELERRRIRLNKARKRFRTAREFKVYANDIAQKINNQLASGWSPFYEEQDIRMFTKLPDVISEYLSEKEKELRHATLISYTSFCNRFLRWADIAAPDIYCSMFNRVLAVRFMDWYYKTGVTQRTYNNTLKQGRALFEWAKEHCYCKENPFALLKTKREQEKRRTLVDPETRARISRYLIDENPAFLIVCHLVHSSLMRPKEIRETRLEHIDLDGHSILIPADTAKNHHARYAPLSDEVVTLIRSLHPEQYNKKFYLIGRGWHPSSAQMGDSMLTKEWIKLRTAISLPETMQLYSLRDTGINGMLKAGIDPLTVMQAADHHDLSMTTRYANHRDDNLISRVNSMSPKF